MLRGINLLAWFIVLVVMLPSIWSILRGKARSRDPARLVYAAFAIMVMGFNLRWLLIPESALVWAVLYGLSLVVAVYTLIVLRVYGRGDHV